ncbi:DUF4239 domain-containing protein [Methylocapsa sp. S129]|uniref:bestrophin-like domain n=1 Tax=Methylocapsa sp. S129 TaxID=1641869 RepID=UPI00131A9FB7|nr:DUF4239 domain-containing protein [Methylocapsa sp. S129]
MMTAVLAFLSVGGSVLFAIVGVLVGRRFVHHHVAEGHNDVLVPLFLTAGVIYAVLLGFMVVGEWESYDSAKANTAEEAALLVPLYRQSKVMAPDKGDEMRKTIREYSEDVVKGWDGFVAGERNRKAGHDVQEMFRILGALTADAKPQEAIAAQLLTTVNQMLLDRNKRYMQAGESLSWIMWAAAIGGGAVTVSMSFILYMDRRWPHVFATSVMAVLIGSLLFTMAVLSRPFVGPLAIDPQPFERSSAVFDDVDNGY